MSQLSDRLNQRIDELFPMPITGDILDKIKADRLRSAFREGIYFSLGEILRVVPDQDNTKPVPYNEAWDEAVGKISDLHTDIFDYYQKLHEQKMAEYDNRNARTRKEVIPHH